jgi:hypothetical protein
MSETNSKKGNMSLKSRSCYIAFDPEKGSKTIIAQGNDVGKVIDSARNKGVKTPAIIFVPKEGVTYLY